MQILFNITLKLLRFMFRKSKRSTVLLKQKFAFLFFLCRFPVFKAHFLQKYMALTGANWASSPQLDCVAVFGVERPARSKIATAMPRFRCAFAYPKTPWFRQCAFIQLQQPTAVFDLAPNSISSINQSTHDFLVEKKIPIFTFPTEYDLMKSAPNVHISMLTKYYPIVLYGSNWEDETKSLHNIVLCCCPSLENMASFVQLMPEKKCAFLLPDLADPDRLKVFLDDFCVTSIVSFGNAALSGNVVDVLNARSLTVGRLPDDTVKAMLLEPCFGGSEADDIRPLAILLDKEVPVRLVPQLNEYRLFSLSAGVSLEHLILFSECTLISCGCQIPRHVSAFCSDNAVPVLQYFENTLSRYGYRKNFPTPPAGSPILYPLLISSFAISTMA